jgi:protein TonB
MLISKFDLYKFEWLELVFENRNKAYGAYELRQLHNRTMVMAMTFTFLGVVLLFGTSAILQHHHPAAPPVVIHTVDLTNLQDKQIKRIPPPVIPHPLPPPPVATVRFVPPVVRPDVDVTERLPEITQLTAAISTTTTKGGPGELPVTIDESANTGTAVTEDNTVYPVSDIQVFPSPIGGEEAWAKFLNKNLRFPQEAQDEGVGGRVFMSFVVEKDGSLSNITVERPAGHGFDEEATRVLKLAKAWKPGIQNGRPVRVKFIIPINFQFNDGN